MTEIKYAAAPASDWRLPEEEPPPAGQMVQLLSIFGKATHGIWDDSGYWVAWAPFLKISPRVKARMIEAEQKWRGKSEAVSTRLSD